MTKIEDRLFHFFIGYTRSNPENTMHIINDSWADYAKQEIERRRYRLIESLSNEELQAIANCDIDLNKIIKSAADSDQ